MRAICIARMCMQTNNAVSLCFAHAKVHLHICNPSRESEVCVLMRLLCSCYNISSYNTEYSRIMSSSGESSPVPSPEPENVACYEECITDEIFIPSAAAGEPSESSTSLQLGTNPQHGIPKVSTSGRVAKRGNKILLYPL